MKMLSIARRELDKNRRLATPAIPVRGTTSRGEAHGGTRLSRYRLCASIKLARATVSKTTGSGRAAL